MLLCTITLKSVFGYFLFILVHFGGKLGTQSISRLCTPKVVTAAVNQSSPAHLSVFLRVCCASQLNFRRQVRLQAVHSQRSYCWGESLLTLSQPQAIYSKNSYGCCESAPHSFPRVICAFAVQLNSKSGTKWVSRLSPPEAVTFGVNHCSRFTNSLFLHMIHTCPASTLSIAPREFSHTRSLPQETSLPSIIAIKTSNSLSHHP